MTELQAITISKMPTLSFTQFWEDESAQDLVEYALVAACIALGTLTGVHGLAGSLANYMNIVLGAFNGALAGHV